ncbi:hypothetical protein LJK88_14845 [Paenibacillus sp. P26]|nr:hypothetical protein LJK88_14845 [Paenibacillus sp. P26]
MIKKLGGKKQVSILASLILGCTLMAGILPVQAATLYSDDFSDGNADGWSTTNGSWSVVQDNGNYVYYQSSTSSEGRATSGSQSWTDYSVEADVNVADFNGSRAIVAGRYKDGNNYYGASLDIAGGGTLELRKK